MVADPEVLFLPPRFSFASFGLSPDSGQLNPHNRWPPIGPPTRFFSTAIPR